MITPNCFSVGLAVGLEHLLAIAALLYGVDAELPKWQTAFLNQLDAVLRDEPTRSRPLLVSGEEFSQSSLAFSWCAPPIERKKGGFLGWEVALSARLNFWLLESDG